MRRGRGVIVMAAGVLTCAAVSAGAECGRCAEYSGLGTFQVIKLSINGITVTAEDGAGNPAMVSVLDSADGDGWGLGVVGGSEDTQVDGNEVLHFSFHNFAGRRVMMLESYGADSDHDGAFGEASLTVLAPNGDPLTTTRVDFNTKSMSPLVADSSIGGFEMTPADGERFRFGVVCAAESEPVIIVDYTELGTYQTTSLYEGGVLVYGWDEYFPSHDFGTIQVTGGKGLGVVGGIFDNTLDEPEELQFQFEGILAKEVWLRFGGTDVDGDGRVEAALRAGGYAGWGLGTSHVSRVGTGVIYVSNTFGDIPLDQLWFRPEGGDRLTVRQIVYTVCPAAGCAGDLDGDGDTDVFDFGVFATDFQCVP